MIMCMFDNIFIRVSKNLHQFFFFRKFDLVDALRCLK